MNRFKQSFGFFMSLLLLISFSVTVIPIDFLHDHSGAQTCKTTTGTSCSHKSHLSLKKSLCWVCGVHFDKHFVKSSDPVAVVSVLTCRLGLPAHVSISFTVVASDCLRGPPAV